MSELESIGKLREYAAYNCRVKGWKDDLKALADAIEAEVAESYMRLPKDEDGVPIRPGDKCVFKRGNLCRSGAVVMVGEELVSFGDAFSYHADDLRHVKPRTLEDVLCDVWKEALDYATSAIRRNPDEVFAERADEIRAMFGEVD